MAPRTRPLSKPMLALNGLLAVAAVALVGYLAYQGMTGRAAAGADTPREAFEEYNAFVRPYLPPTGLRPSGKAVGDWLAMFEPQKREWFRANASAMAFIGMRDADAWRAADQRERESRAMQFLLGQGAWRGGVRQSEAVDEDAGTAEIRFGAGGTEHRMALRRTGTRWLIADFPGAREAIDQRIASTPIP